MKSIKKIAVIGGTGKAGRYLVEELLRRGYTLRLLLRDPSSYLNAHPFVEIIPGDARKYETVKTLAEGCEAIVSTLGQPTGQPSIFSQATQNVLRTMEEQKIQRYILITGLTVDTPADYKNPKTQAATDWMKTNYPETTTDKQTEYQLLTKSALDWTLVRLPWIQLTDEPVEIRVSLEDCPGEQISTASLAHFLIAQLTDSTYVRQAPFIANA